MISLYDDWLLRREKLAEHVNDPFAALQLRIIDFLLARYANDPSVRKPALFPLDGSVRFNARAILVSRRSTIRNPADAPLRAKHILRHIAEINPQESIGAPGSTIPSENWRLPLCSLERPRQHNWYAFFFFDAWIRMFLNRCQEELKHTETLPEPTISYLADLALAQAKSPPGIAAQAFDILEKCQNDSVLAIFWTRGLYSWRPKETVDRVAAYLIQRRTRIANLFRPELASAHPHERVLAARVIGAFGTLDDISLLQDLLSLPEMNDKPEERDAYLEAIQDLAYEMQELTRH